MISHEDRNENDSVDAIPSSGLGCVRSEGHQKIPTLPTRAGDEFYRQNGRRRGICVIINQVDYSTHSELETRNGSNVDAANLEKTFKGLSFEVRKEDNLDEESFEKALDSWSNYDHTDCDAFVLCLLSHGDTESILHPKGRTPFNRLLEPFTGEKCPSLLGKPKLFFIQACQGDNLCERIFVRDKPDAGGDTEKLRKEGVYRFPTHADFLVAYATVPGFCAFRRECEGSWFIRSLCLRLQDTNLVKTRDLLSILTLVNKDVARNFLSRSKKPDLNERKQVSCVYSSLTRILRLIPARLHRHSI